MTAIIFRYGRSPRPQRRGSAYLMVLMVSLVVVAIGLSAAGVERIRLRRVSRDNDWGRARLLATSAVEHALLTIDEARSIDPTWRQTLQNQTVSLALAGGTIEWELQDRRGDPISIDPAKPIYVVGTGRMGPAEHTVRVIVRPAGLALSSLAVAVHADREMAFQAGTVIQSDRLISSNEKIKANSASVFPDVQASSEISGNTYFGTALPYATRLGMPNSDVFDYYRDNGTPIELNTLPGGATDRYLEDVLLSPTSNPFGAPNPEGIYIIDCDNVNLTIRNARILGTLYVKRSGPGSRVAGSVNWTPAVENFPALLVGSDAPMSLAMSSSVLSETSAGVNFNPPGSPYLGEEDEQNNDVYPSVIRGLIYTSNDLILSPSYNRIEGIVVSDGKIRSDPNAFLDITYRPQIAEDPPPGFFMPDGNVRIGAYSWARVPD